MFIASVTMDNTKEVDVVATSCEAVMIFRDNESTIVVELTPELLTDLRTKLYKAQMEMRNNR